ncbi:MAG: DUF5916 domain-containing protein [Longimicrobiales bacterium]|nr:DUF5916 domain-containing protein [Longimicrobiales bacterium]
MAVVAPRFAALWLCAAAVALAVLHATPASAQAGEGVRAVSIAEGDGPLRLDGLLSEPFWARAESTAGFLQREPLEGVPASDDTEVRVVYDGEALYVGIVAHDAHPEGVVARIRQRDRVLSGSGFGFSAAGDDVVAILLDSFRDRRNAVVLAVNPNGAKFDALVSDDGGEVNEDWRGVWEVAATRTPTGWSAEFLIPWRSLRYPADRVQTWGLNVMRFVQRTQEETLWRGWERDGGGFRRVSRAGPLTGLADLPRRPFNLEAKPFLLGRRTQERAPGADHLDATEDAEVGLDLKTELRPGLVLDLTVNTDFAQVEVDDQQVNLTRFDLFFPEKRDFFLENAGIFEFGQRGFFEPPPYLMFFSRRLGIGSGGEVPILGGARLTGRVGRQTVGLLSVATDAAGETDEEVFNVLRVKRDVGESAYVGLMATDRRGSGPANSVLGGDVQLYPHPTLEVSAFASRSFTEGAGGEGWVYRAALDWTRDLWGGLLQFLTVEGGARADMGFVTRTDIRRYQGSLRRSVRPGVLGIRKVDFRPNGQVQTTIGGRFQDWEFGPSLSFDLESGGSVSLGASWGATRVDEDFPVAGRVPVPAGRYRTDEVTLSASTTSARPWQLSGNARRADFFGGDLVSWGGTVSVTPVPAFSLSAGFTRNDVELPGGDFVSDILSLRTTWAFSTTLVTSALVQYNSLTDNVQANVRLNLIHRPGSDLFLVFTEERGVDGALWDVADRGLVAKLTWLVRL